jgi:hypothetical protein
MLVMAGIHEFARRIERPLLAPASQESETPVAIRLSRRGIMRKYTAQGVHRRKGTVAVTQEKMPSATNNPQPPKVSYNRLTGSIVVQPNEGLEPVHTIGSSNRQRVSVRGLSVEHAHADDSSVLALETHSEPRTSAIGRGRVIVRTGR